MSFIEKFKQKSPQERFLFFIGLLAAAIYVTAGIYVIRAQEFPFQLSNTLRWLLGIVLILYAATRVWRTLR